MQFKLSPVLIAVFLLAGRDLLSDEKPLQLELLRVDKIWDQAKHNAFTDLVRYQEKFLCVFREGEGHVSPEGAIRVLESADGIAWTSAALLTEKDYDLRDPKISITPKGELMILGGAAKREGTQPATEHRSFVCFSKDGRNWGELQCGVADLDWWLWRVTWQGEKAYGVAYSCSAKVRAGKEYGTSLLKSDDGLSYIVLDDDLHHEGGPTEATLRFAADGTCYCLQRRDGKPNTALLGTAKAPYEKWTWKDLGKYYGGPNFIQLPDGGPTNKRWVAAGRIITKEKGAHTVLCELDVENGKLNELLELQSGGDTSYPGLVWHDGRLWVSFYSSHEGKTSIYLAQVKVK